MQNRRLANLVVLVLLAGCSPSMPDMGTESTRANQKLMVDLPAGAKVIERESTHLWGEIDGHTFMIGRCPENVVAGMRASLRQVARSKAPEGVRALPEAAVTYGEVTGHRYLVVDSESGELVSIKCVLKVPGGFVAVTLQGEDAISRDLESRLNASFDTIRLVQVSPGSGSSADDVSPGPTRGEHVP